MLNFVVMVNHKHVGCNPFLFLQSKQPADEQLESAKLLVRTGFVQMLGAGLYTYLPFGARVLHKLREVIRRQCNLGGLQEVLTPVMQPGHIWSESGRLTGAYMDEKLVIKDKRGAELVFQPTAEEAAVDILRRQVQSYKQLPLVIYQLQTKFRDEVRPRYGLMRAREFVMLDAYSFHTDSASGKAAYKHVTSIYLSILKNLGLKAVAAEQHATGDVGGSISHELVVESEHGESKVGFREDGSAVVIEGEEVDSSIVRTATAVEVGHNFYLGTTYSKPMDATVDCAGVRQHVEMGCYGLGVSRLLAVIAELSIAAGKLNWPAGIEPYKISLVPLVDNEYLDNLIYDLQNTYGDDIVVDARNLPLNQRLNDAETVGIPVRIVVGEHEQRANSVTVKTNIANATIPRTQLINYLQTVCK